jgi:hypothetical protein
MRDKNILRISSIYCHDILATFDLLYDHTIRHVYIILYISQIEVQTFVTVPR